MSDGSYAGDNFGDFTNNTIVDHAREVDPQLQMIRFDRSAAVKAGSPYESTFVLGYCNGAFGYIPNTHAYDYGCYESHTSNFARDTGDELVQTYTAMLQDLRN